MDVGVVGVPTIGIGPDVALPAVNVRLGVPDELPPPEALAIPIVVTVVATQPFAPVACGTEPAPLIPSSVPAQKPCRAG